MLRTRDDIYQPGLPAPHGEHYRQFVRFARRYAGPKILDLGCGLGAYSRALLDAGLDCVGSDVNLTYLRSAVSSGVPVVAADSALPFGDRSFDSVLLFEVIEHVPELNVIMSEAFRVARMNVLITVPNSEDIETLKTNDVAYAHMLSSDHYHFFDPTSLRELLEPHAASIAIEQSDPIYPYWFLARSVPFYALRFLYRAGFLRPRFFSRLYAVASVRKN